MGQNLQGAFHEEEGQLPRVTVIGTGYLGLTHAVCLADLGHEVLAIDVDAEKIAMAGKGEAGRADLGAVYAAAEALAPHLTSPCLVVGKSTVPVGTARQVMTRMRALA